ncbi:MAG TPA: trigger factor, partial [Spirochaetota bacterium]
MNIQERKLENSRIEITVQVPTERIAAEYENAFKKIQRSAKIAGFRPGKAPLQMVKTHFKERADQEVVESVVKDCYLEAVKEKDLHPISYPRFGFERLVEGKDFSFTASFDVPPSVELGNYKGIAVSERQCSVSDLDVMEEIEGIRENHAVISKKEDGLPVEKGDLAKIKVKRIDNISPELIDATESREITVLAGQRDDKFEFDNHVIGLNVGDTKDVTLSYPADYQYKSVAGQTHLYRIAVTEIQRRALPALDDEFAKDLG